MKKTVLVLIGLFFVSILGFGAIPQIERAALIALYNSTGGGDWTENSGWKTPPLDTDGFAMPGTEGDWDGVKAEDEHVTKIILISNNLNGTIPSEIGNLSSLTDLYLYDRAENAAEYRSHEVFAHCAEWAWS